MQRNEEEILKGIFQKEFKNRHEQVEDENWDLIAANLDKKRFYKFSFSRFNIFYASSIIITTIISLGLLFYRFNPINLPQYKQVTTIVPTDTISAANNRIADTVNVISNTSIKTFIQPSPFSASSSDTKDSQATTHSPLIAADSTFSKTSSIPAQDTSLTIAPKEKTKTVVRKIVYKIKQDTLIQVDTVRKSKRKMK